MALVSQYLFLYAVCVLGIYAEMDSGLGIGVYLATVYKLCMKFSQKFCSEAIFVWSSLKEHNV